jgi:hypothetical protein
MSHPGPLLADYVDGSLDPSTRAEVDAHLRTCATCRAEVSLATAGANAAERLLDPAPPAGVGEAAIAEASRLAAERSPEVTPIAGRGRRRPTTSRILAAAGAAALILLVVVAAPKLGQDSSGSAAKEAAAAGSAGAADYPQATAVEIQHADYSSEAMPDVLTQFGRQLAPSAGFEAALGGSASVAADASAVPVIPDERTAKTDASLLPRATACLNEAFGDPTGTLSRVVRATYAGQPAYLGVYLIGPGADLPPTLLQVSVASVHGCQPLGQTTAKL